MDENLDPEQIRRANEELEKLAKNTEDANSEIKDLSKSSDTASKSLGGLANSSDKASSSFDKTKESTDKLQKDLNELKQKFEDLTKVTKNDLIKNFKDLSKTVTDNKKEQSESTDDVSQAMDDLTESTEKAAKSTKNKLTEDEKYIKSLMDSMGIIKDSTGQYHSALSYAEQKRNEILKNVEQTIGKENLTRIQSENLYLEQVNGLKNQIEQNRKAILATENLTAAQKKHVEQLKSQVEYDSYIDSLKKQVEQNKKATISTQHLTDVQKKQVSELEKQVQTIKLGTDVLSKTKGIRSFEEAINSGTNSIVEYAQKQGVTGKSLIALTFGLEALSIGINGFKKVLDATINAQTSYDKALLNGERGQALVARRSEEIGKASNAVIRQFGELAIAAGAAGVALSFMVPGGILIKGFTALLGLAGVGLGVYTKYQADANDKVLEFTTQLAGLTDKLYEGFNELSNASLGSARGMTGLREDLAKLQMGMADVGKFTNIVRNAGKELAMLGPGAVGGLNNFLNTASSLIKSDLGKQLEYMGINNEKQAEHVLRFMTMQARLGMQQERDAKKLGEAAGKYVLELDRLAILTGATREEQEKARDQVMAIEELRAKMETAQTEEERQLLEKQVKVVETLFASGAKELGAGIARYVASGGKAVDEASSKVMANIRTQGDKVLRGEGSVAEQVTGIATAAREANKKFADTGALTFDAVSGIAFSFREVGDLATAIKTSSDEAKKNNLTLDQYLTKARESQDKLMKEQVELIRKQREDAIQEQKTVLEKYGTAGNLLKMGAEGFGKHVDNFGNTVNKMTGNTGAATTGGTGTGAPTKGSEPTKYKTSKEAEEARLLFSEKSKKLKVELDELDKKYQSDKISEEERKKIQKQYQETNKKLLESREEEKKANRDRVDLQLKENKLAQDILIAEKNIKDEKERLKNIKSGKEKFIFGSPVEEAAKVEERIKKYEAQLKQLKSPPPNAAPATGAPAARGATPAAGSVAPTGESKTNISQKDLSEMGLKIKVGDVQRKDGDIDPRLIDLAKQVQENVPNFQVFTGFNDDYHKNLGGGHPQGKAFDFTLSKIPSKKEGQEIANLLNSMGADYVQDEYNNPSKNATAGHIHAEIRKARNGGIFNGPESGYLIEMHGKEMVVPMPKLTDLATNLNNNSQSKVESQPLNSALPPVTDNQNTNLDRFMSMQTELMEMLANKLDNLDSRLAKSNDIQENILTYSAS